jgi:hypothetical protein
MVDVGARTIGGIHHRQLESWVKFNLIDLTAMAVSSSNIDRDNGNARTGFGTTPEVRDSSNDGKTRLG